MYERNVNKMSDLEIRVIELYLNCCDRDLFWDKFMAAYRFVQAMPQEELQELSVFVPGSDGKVR